jgi:acetoin utilization deacetylase AcuC-like enzyme
MGFCFFNNIALAAEFLTREMGFKRVLIFDFDVHHGNGTQHFFEERADIFFASIHQDPRTSFPGTGFAHERGSGGGAGFTLNVPVPPGMGDEEYLQIFYDQVQPKLDEYKPDFVLVSAGFDAHRDDPLASLNLTERTFRELTRELKQLAGQYAGGRILSLLEGGYDLNALSSCVQEHLLILHAED